jgi:hypothetical protein
VFGLDPIGDQRSQGIHGLLVLLCSHHNRLDTVDRPLADNVAAPLLGRCMGLVMAVHTILTALRLPGVGWWELLQPNAA